MYVCVCVCVCVSDTDTDTEPPTLRMGCIIVDFSYCDDAWTALLPSDLSRGLPGPGFGETRANMKRVQTHTMTIYTDAKITIKVPRNGFRMHLLRA